MSFALHVSLLSLALGLNLGPVPLMPQAVSSAPAAQSSADETALRALAEDFFQTWAAKDLDAFLRLWSTQSSDFETRKKATTELFAQSAMITLKSFVVRQLEVNGQQARVRVEVDVEVIEAETGKAKKGYGKLQRTLEFMQASGRWQVSRELSTFDELVEAVAAAPTEPQRSTILKSVDSLSTQAAILNQAGRVLMLRGENELALSCLEKARDLSVAANDKVELGKSLQRMAAVLQAQGKYTEAIESAQQSLAIAESQNVKAAMADLHGRLATLHTMLAHYELALTEVAQSYALATELSDTYRTAVALTRKANVHTARGEMSQAAELYQQALVLAEKDGDHSLLDACWHNLGMIYRIQGDYRQALHYLQKSVQMSESDGDTPGVAQTLNSIGLVYMHQGNRDVALDYFNRSLSLLGNATGRTTVDVLQNIGDIAAFSGNYEQALQSYGKALSYAQASQDSTAIARILGGIGEAYYLLKKYDEAATHLQRAVDLSSRPGTREAITLMLLLGNTRYRQGNTSQALELANRAALLNRDVDNREITLMQRELLGKIYVALNDLPKARQAFKESIAALESVRATVAGDEREQRYFLESRLASYRGLIRLLVEQGRPMEALVFAERSKARVILDVLQNGRVNIHRAMTATERQQEKSLKEHLGSLNRQMAQATQSDNQPAQSISKLRQQLNKARLSYNAFLTAVYAAHPELKVQRGEVASLRAEDLTGLLPDANTALLEYVVTDEMTYLFAVTKAAGKPAAEVEVYTLPIKRDELTKQTEAFRQQLAARDLGFRSSAFKLYELLLKPAQSQLKGKTNLIIVPDDKLWDLPFQALGVTADRFLIEEAAIAYAPSLTVQREMTKRHKDQRPETSTTLLALGNPVLGKQTRERATLVLRDAKFDPLPEAEQEVRALGQLYGSPRSRVYIGPQAREDRVKNEAGQARILHFATHGTLNNVAPMYSHLVLAQGDKNEDGLLEAWELMQLDLKADLAVLSACETARGRFGAGEGMIGLTWALFVAGVPSTVVSQWQVESASTRDLMVNFHRGINSTARTGKTKATKSEALRQAALKLLKDPETSHPFYWAGFVLVGDGG